MSILPSAQKQIIVRNGSSYLYIELAASLVRIANGNARTFALDGVFGEGPPAVGAGRGDDVTCDQ
jgi:hypothetical protein